MNEALYNARLTLGLTRKEAAKKLSTRPFILKNYEEGYLYLKDKKARKFALAYGLEEDSFIIDDRGYFTAIDYEAGKEKKERFGKIRDALASLPSLIVTLVVIVVSFVMANVGGINWNYTFTQRDRYLPSEYKQIYNEVTSEGNVGSFCVMTTLVDTEEAYVHEIDEYYAVLVPKDSDFYGLISFAYDDPNIGHMNGDTYQFSYYLDCYAAGNCSVNYQAYSFSREMIVDMEYAEYDPATGEINPSLPMEEDVLQMMKDYLSLVKPVANEYLSQYFSSETSTNLVDALYLSMGTTNANLMTMRTIGTAVMFVGGFLVAFGFLILVYGIVRRGKIKKKGLYSKVESLVQEEEEVGTDTREAPHSFDPAPFIAKEDYLRFFFLGIFFVGCLMGVFQRMNSYGWIGPEAYNTISVILSYFKGIGTFMVFFLKLEAIISRRDTFSSFLTCLGISSLFYVGDVYYSVYLTNYGTLGRLLAQFLPSNLFTGLAALALFAFFLLKEPVKAKKWQRVLFHLGGLLPLGYLIAGFVILAIDTNHSISPFLNAGLNGGLFEVCIIGVVYIIFIFIFRRIAFHRYGKKGGEEYLTSSTYTLARNIVLSTVIVILVILNYALPENFPLWTLRRNGFFLLLIPVFLLYRTRVPKSTVKGELLFDGGYLVLLGLPYVISFFISLVPH